MAAPISSLIHTLEKNDLNYLDALEAVIGEFLESGRRMSKEVSR